MFIKNTKKHLHLIKGEPIYNSDYIVFPSEKGIHYK